VETQTILLVDDDAVGLLGHKNSLEKLGHRVRTAASGEQALALLAADSSIDLVLMDLDLGPGLDGAQTARLMLQKRELPVIFLSGHTSPEMVARTDEVVSYGYVVKHTGITVLDASIKMAMRLFRTRQDLARLRQRELRFSETEQQFRFLTENIRDVIWVMDLDRLRFTYISPSIMLLRGFTVEEAMAQDISQSLAPESAERVMRDLPFRLAAFNEGREGDYIDELQQPCKDGRIIWVECATRFHRSTDGTIEVLGVSRDITARKQAEDQLRLTAARLQLALEAAKSGTWEWEVASGANIWSAELWKLYGLDPLRDQASYEAWLRSVHPDDREQTVALVAEASRLGREISLEYRVNLPDSEARWLMSRAKPQLDEAGRVSRYLGVVIDITDSKRAEEHLRELLREKDLILKEAHHRIKNNINAITGLLQLQASDQTDPAIAELFRIAINRMRSVGLLYQKLHDGASDAAPVDDYLGSLAREIVAVFPCPAAVRLELELEHFSLEAKTLSALGLLVNELMTNSLKYAFAGRAEGRIRITVRRSGGSTVLTVGDDGLGLPESLNPGRSKGLGLQLVHILVQQLDGRLEIDRTRGTSFSIAFGAG
jgi:PAS domain S-box-containing protein